MRTLDRKEIELVSGGAPSWEKPAERAAPGTDVTTMPEPGLPGNRTGWCRGYGNIKDGMAKHDGSDCGLS